LVRALGIETATRIASVGIAGADHVLAERSLPQDRSHARTLLPLIDATLAAAGIGWHALDLIAVSIGPGSFTGLRIGLSVAKGLAMATGLPVVGVPTLEAYAATAGPRPGLVCPVLDARKGEVYAAAFSWLGGRRCVGAGGEGNAPPPRGADGAAPSRLACVAAPRAIAPERFAASIEAPCTLIGDGVDAYATAWRSALGEQADLIPFAALPPSGAVIARLGVARAAASGVDALADLEPRYCRLSEAELTHGRRAAARSDAVSQAGVHKIDRG
jgi:tRNA threonylcarbamoyladenosine biosynthesis protein TsaB